MLSVWERKKEEAGGEGGENWRRSVRVHPWLGAHNQESFVLSEKVSES